MAGLLNPERALEQRPAPMTRPARQSPDTPRSTGELGGNVMDSDLVDDENEPNVTEEEQRAKDDFVKAGFELMYKGGEVNPFILQLLDNDPADLKEIFGEALPLDEPGEDGRSLWEAEGPVIALAATAVVVVLEVLRRMPEEPEGDIILHAGSEILEDIAEIARLAGKREYTEAEVGEALRKGADLFREAAAEESLINLDVAKAEFNEIVAADKEGRLAEIIPQLGG